MGSGYQGQALGPGDTRGQGLGPCDTRGESLGPGGTRGRVWQGSLADPPGF